MAVDKTATAAAMASRQFNTGKGFPQVGIGIYFMPGVPSELSIILPHICATYSLMLVFLTSDAEPGERASHPGRRPKR